MFDARRCRSQAPYSSGSYRVAEEQDQEEEAEAEKDEDEAEEEEKAASSRAQQTTTGLGESESRPDASGERPGEPLIRLLLVPHSPTVILQIDAMGRPDSDSPPTTGQGEKSSKGQGESSGEKKEAKCLAASRGELRLHPKRAPSHPPLGLFFSGHASDRTAILFFSSSFSERTDGQTDRHHEPELDGNSSSSLARHGGRKPVAPRSGLQPGRSRLPLPQTTERHGAVDATAHTWETRRLTRKSRPLHA
ncbi:hypothetical protein CDD83_9772 [Cordyceps sp. RAO-2017]|nr:hypothetical protein CDD83_9772 [Cordyceps sp. RAO-2017]